MTAEELLEELGAVGKEGLAELAAEGRPKEFAAEDDEERLKGSVAEECKAFAADGIERLEGSAAEA